MPTRFVNGPSQAIPLTLTDETGLLSQVAVAENLAAGELFGRIQRQFKKLTRRPFDYRFSRPTI